MVAGMSGRMLVMHYNWLNMENDSISVYICKLFEDIMTACVL